MKHNNVYYYLSNSPLYGSLHGIDDAMFAVDAAMMLGIQATNCIAIQLSLTMLVVQC